MQKHKILIYAIFILGAFFRIWNLGYSDYQGDEIKALYLPKDGQDTVAYFLGQKKGPLQFFVTYLIKFINPDYSNEFITRLPFALAGTFSVIVFYYLAKKYIGTWPAIYATFFFATNGFLVGLSRIAQYQQFVIMFMLLAVYLFSLAVDNAKYKFSGFLGATICWALAILAHYDGLFIAPVMFVLFVSWLKKYKTWKLVIINAFVFVFMLGFFYVPFVMSLTPSTLVYWQGRIDGSVSAKISSSMYLFKIYQPIYSLQIHLILFALGILGLGYKLSPKKLKSLNVFADLNLTTFWPVILWMIIPWLFLEVFVSVPGTHIYTYLIPAFMIVGLGVSVIQNLVLRVLPNTLGKVLFIIGTTTIFAFLSYQIYQVFVDHRVEYPWENKQFLLWTLPKPTAAYHLSLFGFPYNRNWEGIREFTKQHPEITAYSCNERAAISRHYIDLEKSADKAGILIYIQNPMMLNNFLGEEKTSYWATKYAPDYTFSRYGRELVKIYIMPSGIIDEIIDKGY